MKHKKSPDVFLPENKMKEASKNYQIYAFFVQSNRAAHQYLTISNDECKHA